MVTWFLYRTNTNPALEDMCHEYVHLATTSVHNSVTKTVKPYELTTKLLVKITRLGMKYDDLEGLHIHYYPR